MNDNDPYDMENHKDEKLYQFASNTFSNNQMNSQNYPNVNNFKSIRSLRNNLDANVNSENLSNNNNNVINLNELNSNNLAEEMRNNPYINKQYDINDFKNNLNVDNNLYNAHNNNNNYDYEENYQGGDNNAFVQNLSEYNQSQYGSIKQKNALKNNIQAGNQFAKTIVHLDDEEMRKKNSKKNAINEQNLSNNIYTPSTISQMRNKINLNQKSGNYPHDVSNLVIFFFINPHSGTQTGLKILNMGVRKVEFNASQGMVFIYNMKDPINLEMGIQCLKAELEKGLEF